jgi:hypothetical protein
VLITNTGSKNGIIFTLPVLFMSPGYNFYPLCIFLLNKRRPTVKGICETHAHYVNCYFVLASMYVPNKSPQELGYCQYNTRVYPKVFGLSHIETNTRWGAAQTVIAAKLTRLTHKIAIQLHLVAESCTICNSRSRTPVRKFLDTLSYAFTEWRSLKAQAQLYLYLTLIGKLSWRPGFNSRQGH